ncbi:MAG TPA: hypothetical protein VEL77_15125 [Rugosimonospora sp.]|nr:hypothetical protein [Rugosimonospora sp.]
MASPSKDRLRRANASKLTPVESMENLETRKRLESLLREALVLKVRMSADEEDLERIKTELGGLVQALNLAGVRSGLVGFECSGWQRRSNLQKSLLVDLLSRYGAPLEELERCYTTGEPYLMTRLHVFDAE